MLNLVDNAKSMAEKPKKKKWIKKAIGSNKGALHRHLGVPEHEKIPEEKLRGALYSGNETIRKEAQMAMTLKGMKHKYKGKSTKSKIAAMYGHKE